MATCRFRSHSDRAEADRLCALIDESHGELRSRRGVYMKTETLEVIMPLILWLLGVPLSVIIVLALVGVF